MASSKLDSFEHLTIEIVNKNDRNIILTSMYRPPATDMQQFIQDTSELLKLINTKRNKKKIIVAGDFNVDLLKINDHVKTNDFLNTLISYSLIPTIVRPTRITDNTAALIDNIFVDIGYIVHSSGIIYDDLSDHFPTFTELLLKNPLSDNPHLPSENETHDRRSFTKSNFDKFYSLLNI